MSDFMMKVGLGVALGYIFHDQIDVLIGRAKKEVEKTAEPSQTTYSTSSGTNQP